MAAPDGVDRATFCKFLLLTSLDWRLIAVILDFHVFDLCIFQ